MTKNSDTFTRYLERELAGFYENNPWNSRELLRLYKLCNFGRPGRKSHFRKDQFAIYWVYLEWLKHERIRTGKGSKVNKKFKSFLQNSPKIIADLDTILNEKTIAKYKKRGVIEMALSNPKNILKANQIENIEKELSSMKLNFSPQALELIFQELAAMNPEDKKAIEEKFKELKKESKLAGKIFKYLKDQKAKGCELITQRQIARKFSKRLDELKPILENMVFDKVIVWNKNKKAVRLNYNPRDRRKFIWLGESSWPRSPFEPYLQKGKTYHVRDFRINVVEEWIKTKVAKWKD